MGSNRGDVTKAVRGRADTRGTNAVAKYKGRSLVSKAGGQAGTSIGAAYLSMYCSVLPVHEQYSHFLKTYEIKSK
jgi:hypothetical protein